LEFKQVFLFIIEKLQHTTHVGTDFSHTGEELPPELLQILAASKMSKEEIMKNKNLINQIFVANTDLLGQTEPPKRKKTTLNLPKAPPGKNIPNPPPPLLEGPFPSKAIVSVTHPPSTGSLKDQSFFFFY
jgi:hypothetical protein